MGFPMEVQSGDLIVKIYQIENKRRDSFTVSYFADGKPRSKMFARFDEAHTDAKSKAVSLSNGELDGLPLGGEAERITSEDEVEVVRPTEQSGSLVAGHEAGLEAASAFLFVSRRPRARLRRPKHV